MPKDYVRLTQPLVRDSRDAPAAPRDLGRGPSDRSSMASRRRRPPHGPMTFGIFSCSKATNEVNFAAQKFARVVLGSNNIDSCNRT